jgi:hypothetical protein
MHGFSGVFLGDTLSIWKSHVLRCVSIHADNRSDPDAGHYQ